MQQFECKVKFDVYVSVYRDKFLIIEIDYFILSKTLFYFLIIEPTRCTNFSKGFILK
jgi:hypothetical protein